MCNNGFVQLVILYENSNEEYVQYCHDGKWHFLCAGGGTWSRVEANVVCRQLGLSSQGMLVLMISSYMSLQSSGAKRGGGGRTPRTNQHYFMFGDTSCAGGERNIGECKGISYLSTCGNKEGWVECQPGKSINFCI